jgi:hypothetical protein
MAKPDRPLLVATKGTPDTFRPPPGGGGDAPRGPRKSRQIVRLDPAFEALARALARRQGALQAEASGAMLEQVLVIETNGTVKELYETVTSTPGLAWLAEEDLRDLPPDEDFFITNKPQKSVGAQLYLLLFNQEAIANLLSLWKTWSSQPRARLPADFRAWAKVFAKLRTIRPWSVRDRLQETRVLDAWRDRVAAGYETVTVEIELWFRAPDRRAMGERRVREYVNRARGSVTGMCVVEEIAYHALVVRLPIRTVETILEDPEVELLQCEDVRLLRPTGQAGTQIPEEEPVPATACDEPGILGNPVVALLDGLPLENHQRLAGRLVVDDPDQWSETYPVRSRSHGTAMASLILHGDLSAGLPASSRRLYVRPIMRPDGFDGKLEVAPEDGSWVDLVHGAVRRIVAGEGDEPAAAPTVKIINLSIGDPYQPFVRSMSPLAKLLDWLAWRYRVLFIVSAGNHLAGLTVPANPTATTVVAAIASEHRLRRLLSPAEAMNALTVGGTPEDHAGAWLHRAPGETDFGIPGGLPDLISAWGRGHRRAVKPDVLAPGGRTVFVPAPNLHAGSVTYRPAVRARFPPGQSVAAPAASAGDLSGTRFMSGTSVAAATTSRLAGAIADVLEELHLEPNGETILMVPASLWIRTLIAHGASWGPGTRQLVEEAVRIAGHKSISTDELSAVLGFGRIDGERVLRCTAERATVLAGGSISADARIVHQIPLPPSMNAHTGWRRLTVTLSWFSPIHATHRKYRRAALWFEPPASILTVKRHGVDWQAVRRGTLQHEVLEGDAYAINILPGATLDVPVSCIADAGPFEEPISYALAVSLEVATGVKVHVYDEVRERIATRVVVRPGGPRPLNG